MRKKIKSPALLRNFCKCGAIGLCMEFVFTSLESLQKRDMRLMGQTSVWMFPIYGLSCFIPVLGTPVKKCKAPVRGLWYAGIVWLVEYTSGRFLRKHALCPWDYSRSRYNIDGLIRLDYILWWSLMGLFFEKMLTRSPQNSKS